MTQADLKSNGCYAAILEMTSACLNLILPWPLGCEKKNVYSVGPVIAILVSIDHQWVVPCLRGGVYEDQFIKSSL